MRKATKTLDEILGPANPIIEAEMDMTFSVSDRIVFLMEQKGLSKKGLADALGKRPSEVTKWISGQHNFTIATLAMLSAFFGEPIIEVVK